MGYTQEQYHLHAVAKHKWDNKANKAQSDGNYDLEYKYRGKAKDARSHANSLYTKLHPEAKYEKGHMKAMDVFRSKMEKADTKRSGTTSFY